MSLQQTISTLLSDGFILVFNQDDLDLVKTAEALQQAGIHNIEVTCRISDPLVKIRALRKAMPTMAIGGASLIDFPNMLARYNQTNPSDPLPSVDEVAECGVDYLVSAVNFSPRSFERYKEKLVMIPGCSSVTEIASQYNLGAHFCKLFPASNLGGVGFIKAIDPALHKLISIVPTGGTNMSNIPDYIAAGVLVLGGSFSMLSKTALVTAKEGDYKPLAEEFTRVKNEIDRLRKEKWPGIDFHELSLQQVIQATGRAFNCSE